MKSLLKTTEREGVSDFKMLAYDWFRIVSGFVGLCKGFWPWLLAITTSDR